MSEVNVFTSFTTSDSSPGGAPSINDEAIEAVEDILSTQAESEVGKLLQTYDVSLNASGMSLRLRLGGKCRAQCPTSLQLEANLHVGNSHI